MIYDKLSNCHKYNNSILEKAFQFLLTLTEDKEDGRYDISENVWANVMSVKTRNISDGEMELHKNHIDIHYILKGEEVVQFAFFENDNLSHYNDENDIGFVKNIKADSMVKLKKGEFYLVFENRLHKPTCHQDGISKELKKAVVKIKI